MIFPLQEALLSAPAALPIEQKGAADLFKSNQ